jgi:peptide subunit release factor 1 (eRF1)
MQTLSIKDLNLDTLSSPTTNMVSLYIAKDYNLVKVKDFLSKEISTSINIKDKSNRNKVQEALKSIQTVVSSIKNNDKGYAIFAGSCF